jgi:molecular chaperone GrpE
MSEQNNQPEQELEAQDQADNSNEEVQVGEELSAEAEIAVLNAELEAAKK